MKRHLAGVALALAASTFVHHHTERYDTEQQRKRRGYGIATTHITRESVGWTPTRHRPRGNIWSRYAPLSRTNAAFLRAAGRDCDAVRIERSLAKRERKNARRLALAIGGA